jgi:uncharacterized protein (TIGR02391 family)
MADPLSNFEKIARSTRDVSHSPAEPLRPEHPFETRNIHSALPKIVNKLFDDGHYAQATFEAFKFIDKEVGRLSKSPESGFKLMMAAFPENAPLIKLTGCSSTTEKDEQKGFQFLFAGSILAIRNPRGHDYGVRDTPDQCLDHLAVASLLLRRLEEAGLKLKGTP